MPESGSESLEELLKQIIAADNASKDAFTGGETGPAMEGEQSVEGPQAPAVEAVSGQSGGNSGRPSYEVEIIPPETFPAPAIRKTLAQAGPEAQQRRQPDAAIPGQELLEGKIEIRVMPPVASARLVIFERALKERGEIRWMGTWGKPKEGTTVHVLLNVPMPVSQLFDGAASVNLLKVSKGAKGPEGAKSWQIKVTLPGDSVEVVATASALPESPVLPAPTEQPAPAGQQSALSPEPPLVYLEPPDLIGDGGVEVVASPIASLDALNRFQEIITSFSPGCRIINVLSLDGASTVMITLEGISRADLFKKLQERMGGIGLEVSNGRLVAKLPDSW
ncbi:MAG: hypothetical protein Q8O86_08785 [Dehalococcoidia bacterium]|nr:hypothetical protein [Dehalococcoidia bacterium]